MRERKRETPALLSAHREEGRGEGQGGRGLPRHREEGRGDVGDGKGGPMCTQRRKERGGRRAAARWPVISPLTLQMLFFVFKVPKGGHP